MLEFDENVVFLLYVSLSGQADKFSGSQFGNTFRELGWLHGVLELRGTVFWLLECGLRALVRVGGKKPTGSCTTHAHYDATLLKAQRNSLQIRW